MRGMRLMAAGGLRGGYVGMCRGSGEHSHGYRAAAVPSTPSPPSGARACTVRQGRVVVFFFFLRTGTRGSGASESELTVTEEDGVGGTTNILTVLPIQNLLLLSDFELAQLNR
jgi:hypothetical protein